MNFPSPSHQKEKPFLDVGIKGIAFDLDDTLFSRRVALEGLLQSWSNDGLSSSALEEILVRDGDGDSDRAEFFRWLAGYLHADESGTDLHRRFVSELPRHIPKQDDVITLLNALREKGYSIAILSNGGSVLQRAKLKACGILECLHDSPIIISGETAFDKPDREIFQLLARKMNLPASEIFFVGDHLINDVGGALARGLHVGWMRLGRPIPVELPSEVFVIDELGDLLTHFKSSEHH